MNDTPGRRELIEDLELLCDGRIEAGRFARLQGRLRDDPEAQRTYLDFVDTHLALKRLSRPGQASGVAIPPSPRASPRTSRVRSVRSSWLGAAALLLALLAVGFLIRGRPVRDAGPKVWAVSGDGAPVLAQTSAARFFGRESLPDGSPLRSGEEYALTRGLVELAFEDGARAIIKAPAVFLVEGRARLVLKLGRCSVHAPDGAEGFRVETPSTDVVDLGTRFSVDVDDTGGTDVQVLDGLADVYPGTSPGSRAGPVRLATGQARRYPLGQRVSTEDLAFDASRSSVRVPDGDVSYAATERDGGGVEELRGVSVQRGGVLLRYDRDDLIGIDLIHYHSGGGLNNATTRTGDLDPAPRAGGDRRRASLIDRDANLNTGVINPGGSSEPLDRDPTLNNPEDPLVPNTPGMAVRFREPVVNSAGPDVVFFELQVIVHPERGDPFRVSPLKFAPGLRTYEVPSFDIDLASPEARVLAGFRLNGFVSPSRSLDDLLTGRHNGGSEFPVRAKALAVGIDLSDLGYQEGDSVEGLFFQDALDDDNLVDPVFIAGLPPVKLGDDAARPR